nr:MAG TPA: hypothetical protein [Caudoviricetes sp.]
MVDNIHVRTDPAGNIKPDKQKSTEKVDGSWQPSWPWIELFGEVAQVRASRCTTRGDYLEL